VTEWFLGASNKQQVVAFRSMEVYSSIVRTATYGQNDNIMRIDYYRLSSSTSWRIPALAAALVCINFLLRQLDDPPSASTGGAVTTTVKNSTEKAEESQSPASKIPIETDTAFTAKSVDLVDTDARPRDLHFAIVGDSVSRFQYMALAHFLHYGTHIRNEDRPQKLTLKDKDLSPRPGDTYHDFSKVILHPNEQCDCFRLTEWKPEVFVDNRYFFDPIRNNSLTFLLKYGYMEAHGHWPPDEVHNPHNQSFEQGNYFWNGNWSVAFQHLAAIRPKPKFVIFNAGHHRNQMTNPVVQDDIVKILQELDFIGIYKYTTCKKGNMRSWRNTGHEDQMCNKMERRCVNYNWTCALGPYDYYDHVHLHADVNQRMNEELLAYLNELDLQ